MRHRCPWKRRKLSLKKPWKYLIKCIIPNFIQVVLMNSIICRKIWANTVFHWHTNGWLVCVMPKMTKKGGGQIIWWITMKTCTCISTMFYWWVNAWCMWSMIESFCWDDTAYFMDHVTIFSANMWRSFSVKVLLLPHISSNSLTASIGLGKGVYRKKEQGRTLHENLWSKTPKECCKVWDFMLNCLHLK